MRFIWQGKEFEGPPIADGILTGFTVGELRYAKKVIRVQRIEEIDMLEGRALYYVLAIRRVDHELIPFTRDQFDKLVITDFTVAPHVADLDTEGDCRECLQEGDAEVHLPAEDSEPDPTQPADESVATES